MNIQMSLTNVLIISLVSVTISAAQTGRRGGGANANPCPGRIGTAELNTDKFLSTTVLVGASELIVVGTVGKVLPAFNPDPATPTFIETIASAIPPNRKRATREQPKLGPLKEHIDQMLEADRQAPRKQRHTAHRIWNRLRKEHPELPVAEPTVRRYVGLRKRELGLKGRDIFVPQSYSWARKRRWTGSKR